MIDLYIILHFIISYYIHTIEVLAFKIGLFMYFIIYLFLDYYF